MPTIFLLEKYDKGPMVLDTLFPTFQYEKSEMHQMALDWLKHLTVKSTLYTLNTYPNPTSSKF